MRRTIGLAWRTATDGRDVRGAARELFYGALGAVPGAFAAYENRRHPDRSTVRAGHTDLVIDGYLGCANTYFAHVVIVANLERGLDVARHSHRPAQIVEGVRRGVPTVLLTRPPIDAITSIVARQARNPAVELARYAAFYAGCRDVAAQTVVAPFDEVTNATDDVIARINRRCRLDLAGLASLGPEAKEGILNGIDHSYRLKWGDAATTRRAAPSEERSASRDAVRDELAAPRHRRALQACEELHAELDAIARRQRAESQS